MVMSEDRKRFFANCMRPLSKNIRQKKFVGFDVETYGDENLFYSGGLYWIEEGRERFEYFTEKDAMAKFMLQRRFRNRYFIATNLSFDFTVVFFNTPYWEKFKTLMRDGSIIQAAYKLTHNHGTIRFIDTSNYAQLSVENLGRVIGVAKMGKPEFLGQKPQDAVERLELMNYNRQDCKISHDFAYFFQEGVNLVGGTMKLTIGSTVLQTWRMNYQPTALIKEAYVTGDEEIRDFIFAGYYGGRTEVYKRGVFENVNYYDVNSLYPYVMSKNRYPLPQSARKIPKHKVSIENIHAYEGVSECEVTYEGDEKPLLPLRYNQKLCFPRGHFTGVWNHCELRKALELGYTIKPRRQLIYTQTFNPFEQFVQTFYELRQRYKREGNPFEFVVKVMMNSLYGKFGMKKVEEYTVADVQSFETHKDFLKTVEGREFTIKNGKVIMKGEKKFNGIYSFPILASYTTSYARLHMYEYLKEKNVIYTDTDSIVTSKEYEADAITLGALKLESVIHHAVFVKPKLYIIDDKVKVKGLSRASVDDFHTILSGGGVKKKKFLRLKEAMRRGLPVNKIVEVEKLMTLIDNKREWEHNDLSRVAESVALRVEL